MGRKKACVVERKTKMIPKCFKLKSEKEQKKELEEKESTRDRIKYGRDGYIIVGEKKFTYKKIEYLIRILRYYNFDDGFIPLSNRITSYHAVVETTKKSQKLKNLIKGIDEYAEFLWHDTIHTWNDKQTIEEQIQECHKNAKEDINDIEGHYPKLAKDKIKELKKQIKELKELRS